MNEAKMVAALCVKPRSVYFSLPNVVCYDERRDVRSFAGGMPVIAHPPCRAWSAFCAHQAKPLPGEKELGPLCVGWLRKCGGVLEHPAHSRLFEFCGLPLPGNQPSEIWAVEVLQTWWGGHTGTRKRTWLVFFGIPPKSIRLPLALLADRDEKRLWQIMRRSSRSETCAEMAMWLVDAARKAR